MGRSARSYRGFECKGRAVGAGLMEAWRQLHRDANASPNALILATDGLDSVLPNPRDVLATVPGNKTCLRPDFGCGGPDGIVVRFNHGPTVRALILRWMRMVHRLHDLRTSQAQAMGRG